MTYEEIEGWFDFAALYYEQVRRARPGARFVEVGAWKGKSTAYLARAIKDSGKNIDLTVVDTWKGSSDDEANHPELMNVTGDLFEQFCANMEACGVDDVITAMQCPSVRAAREFEDGSLDFVFIDADHAEAQLYADMKAWWPKLRPGGLMAGHDYWEPSANAAVRRFVSEQGQAVYGDGANSHKGYRCWAMPKPITTPAKILLALPSYDGSARSDAMLLAGTCAYSGPGRILRVPHYTSLLAANFNQLWVMAINDPTITHFAMLHADITPMAWWLDVLMHELVAENAQMVSTVIPIKDDCGVTSTGIFNPMSKWAPKRRFTMAEVLSMPATFGPAQTPYPDHKLVLNTGCWMADLRDPRWKTVDANGELIAHFEINDRIIRMGDQWVPQCQPEDFNFSNIAQDLGMKVLATRKVQAHHYGCTRFPNDALWGKWLQDEATRIVWEAPTEENLVGAEK